MKKIIKTFIIFTIGFNCIACNPKRNNYSISVIDTSSTTNKSQITFYDSNLTKKNIYKYNYAELGTHFYQPQYKNSNIYLVPRGIGNKHDEKKIISINKKQDRFMRYTLIKITFSVYQFLKDIFIHLAI